MYLFFDGDNIGSTVARLMLTNELERASSFSKSVILVMRHLEQELKSQYSNEVKVLINGGDDLFVFLSIDVESCIELAERTREIFSLNNTENVTMSCGIGLTIDDALASLTKAKLLGRNRTIVSERVQLMSDE